MPVVARLTEINVDKVKDTWRAWAPYNHAILYFITANKLFCFSLNLSMSSTNRTDRDTLVTDNAAGRLKLGRVRSVKSWCVKVITSIVFRLFKWFAEHALITPPRLRKLVPWHSRRVDWQQPNTKWIEYEYRGRGRIFLNLYLMKTITFELAILSCWDTWRFSSTFKGSHSFIGREVDY